MEKLIFKNVEEAKQAFNNKDIRLSQHIVKKIKENSDAVEKIHIVDLVCKEENTSIVIMLSPEDFYEALTLALENFEKNEMYEDCYETHNLIKSLEE